MAKRRTKMDVLSSALRIFVQGFTKHIDKIKDIKRRTCGQTAEELEELLCKVTKNKDDAKQMIDDIDKSAVLNSETQARLQEKLRLLEENECHYERIKNCRTGDNNF